MSSLSNTPMRLIPVFTPKIVVSILAETEDYNHRIMNIPAMWKRTMGEGVKVVVLDSGLPKHVDLKPAGSTSFVEGYLEDKCGHSTHCGGIIAATAFNDMGIRGIAPNVEHYYGAVLGADGVGTFDQIMRGIYWAVDEIGADVISMSLGGPTSAGIALELEKACQYAVDHGVTLFAAAGNDGGTVLQPAMFDSVYAVAAIDKNMTVADFSSRGPQVDFAAGGVDIYSTYLNNTYAQLSGTSMATPAIAAVAALVISDARKGPNPRKLTPAEVGEKLKKIAYDVGPAGADAYYGNGIPIFSNTADDTPGQAPEDIKPPTTGPGAQPGAVKAKGLPASDCIYWRMFANLIGSTVTGIKAGKTTDDAIRDGIAALGTDVAAITALIKRQ